MHAAFVLRIMAHTGIDIHRPEYTLALADRALSLVRHRASPATQALYIVTRARALVYAGQDREARRELDRAGEAANAKDPDIPFHAALWGPVTATVDSHVAKTLSQLGDHVPAEKYYLDTARSRREQNLTRIAGLSLASAAKAQYMQGRIEQACATWNQALDLMDGVRSERVRTTIANLNRRLNLPRIRGVRAVRELRARLRVGRT